MLVKNNEETINSLLNSMQSINCEYLIGDLGCSDKTIDILVRNNAKIIRLSGCEDFSLARNELIRKTSTDWILSLHPYECFLSGLDEIILAVSGPVSAYNIGIIQGDTLTRQTRLWHKSMKISYVNPVYETIEAKSEPLNAFVSSTGTVTNPDIKNLTKKWHEKKPLLSDPLYYMAFNELLDKNWDSFINYADLYLHQQKNPTMSKYMTHYYLSLVHCYVKKDYKNAINHIIMCIIKNPTMAEFWCLLGDIFYNIKQYDKAYCFYENAKILGSRRLALSDWPMEISKYDEYPTKMMDSCKQIISGTNYYSSLVNKV